jgi:ubiquinone/menaquinone biosynthesis C-methylase UbiE
MLMATQDKRQEIEFFNRHAAAADYEVFEPASSIRIVDKVLALADLEAGAQVLDVGCGSGVFTRLLRMRGMDCCGLDLSQGLLRLARGKAPDVLWVAGDAERLPFADESLDAIVLSGIVHHLPDPAPCAREVCRVLRHGGQFVAFDPNRRNPFMWLYRDRGSPFYSPVGVTPNERPVVPSEVAAVFATAGLTARLDYLSGLRYAYVVSAAAGHLLPFYNFLDGILFRPVFMRSFSAFVFTYGTKP